MKQTLAKTLLSSAILLVSIFASAQSKFPVLSLPDNSRVLIDKIASNSGINADSTYKILNSWTQYPVVENTGREYFYYYKDPIFGKIPLRVYIPSNYKNTRKSPCVLMMHGATGLGTFTGIDSLETFDPPALFSALKKQNYIVIRPISDRDKHFDWAVNQFGGRKGNAPNPTYQVLKQIITSLKRVLNIDDNRVYALGHSDGSDGAVSMAVYEPDQFAGVVAYNSMLNVIFGKDFYIRNIVNRPAYIVHSDLDNLRPIQIARLIIDSLTKIDNRLSYKEYIGYQHEDKHIDKDIRYGMAFLNTESRNPFQSHIYLETNINSSYNTCDWVRIISCDTLVNGAAWYKPLDFPEYDKIHKKWMKDLLYYEVPQKSSAVKASFINNIFNIETSRVGEIELSISPVMVNLEQPVIVNINGKQVFNAKVTADKNFLLKGFENNFDRQALWVNSIKLKISQ